MRSARKSVVFSTLVALGVVAHALAQAPAAEKKAEAPPTGRAALAKSETAWTILKTEPYRGKQDDIHFINPRQGWYVNGSGKIYATSDGGATWTKQLDKQGSFFRCVAFLDEKNGFVGTVGAGYYPDGTDTTPLYQTTDGGATWTAVTTIEGPAVVGLCAIEVVKTPFVNKGELGERVRLVATGRVGGPAAMIASDDLGKTWQRIALPEIAAAAFDVHFFDAVHGVLATATSGNLPDSHALILTTDDGGKTWQERYRSTRPMELTWKISFPSREVGYVTIQSYNPDPAASARFVAKTTDGGKTWAEVPLVDDHKVRQFGVAFIDEQRGWVGAMPGGFETTDGGKTWLRADFGNAVNKIRVVREEKATHLFAIGVNVAKLELPRP